MSAERKYIKSLDAYKAVCRLKGARKAKSIIVAILKESEGLNYQIFELGLTDKLNHLFVFRLTKEGFNYWWRVTDKLSKRSTNL